MRTSSRQPPLSTPLNRSDALCPSSAWIMNEGGGQMLFDGMGRTNLPGALSNGAVFQKSVKGNAVFFDGTNDFGKITNLDLSGTKMFTISIWLKHTTSSTLLVLEQSTNYNLNPQAFAVAINFHAAGDIFFSTKDISPFNSVWTTLKSYNDGQWHHVVFTANRQLAGTNQIFIYVDGVKDTTQDPSNSNNQTQDFVKYDMYIASRGGASLFYPGLITNIMIWKRALSLSEIRQLYANPYSMYVNNYKLL